MKGKNRTYRLASGATLLRNAGSVYAANDGWWFCSADTGYRTVRANRAFVLVLLRQRPARI